MKLFNRSFMNGATLFGVSLTLFALGFGLINLSGTNTIILFVAGYIYLIASVLAFFFPWLSE
jgi:hypothetical protein